MVSICEPGYRAKVIQKTEAGYKKAHDLSQRGTKLRQATLNRFELACAISPVALWKQQYHRVMPEGGLDSERLSLNS